MGICIYIYIYIYCWNNVTIVKVKSNLSNTNRKQIQNGLPAHAMNLDEADPNIRI